MSRRPREEAGRLERALRREPAILGRVTLRRLECEVCGSGFWCSQLPICWCLFVRTEREHLADLARVASDCVCPSCLRSPGRVASGKGSERG